MNDAYKDHFFLVQFPVQKITAFQVRPKGASFEMIHEHVFLSGMMASSLQFSPDGSLFIADWDGMWNPSGRGALWKLDDPKFAHRPIRAEVRGLIASGLRDRSLAELTTLLGHADQRIRLKAQFEWVRRGEARSLIDVAARKDLPQLARVHALWGIGQAGHPVDPRRLPFGDPDPEIRAQTAKVAGDLRLVSAAPQLGVLLADPSPHVRFHVGIAVGKTGGAGTRTALISALIANSDDDAFLRHALVMGLTGSAKAAELMSLADHPNVRVRTAAVLALRRQRSPGITRFLADASPVVRAEVVRGIHDDTSIPGGLSAVAGWAERPLKGESEAVVRRVLNASLRLGRDQDALRLLRFSLDTTRPESFRMEALECLADWNRKPFLDRVEGLVRELHPVSPGLGNRLIREHLAEWMAGGPRIAATLVRLIERNGIDVPTERMLQWVSSADAGADLRSSALRLLVRRDAASVGRQWPRWLDEQDSGLRLAAWEAAAQTDPEAMIREARRREAQLFPAERQKILRLAGGLRHPAAVGYLVGALDQLRDGRLPAALALDAVEAADGNPDPAVRSALAAVSPAGPKAGAAARLKWVLAGGNAVAGQDLFRNHVGTQCVRCHDAGGEGHQAGPVLTGIGSRATRAELLESLLDPSAKIADGFAQTTVFLRDGDVVDGVRTAETSDAVTLRLPAGELRTIQRKDIERLAANPVSPMPPIGDLLKPAQLRDLVEFLATWK